MRRRHGFTIVEMLVAMALIMLIMAILSEAFVAGLTTFRDLKGIGDMDQKLRAALINLRRDLSDDHFGTTVGSTGGSPARLSELSTTAAPTQGFLAIWQGAPSDTTLEGVDASGIPSLRSPIVATGSHLLHFTVNRAYSWNNGANIKYGRRENYFAGNAPGALAGLSRFPDGQNYYSQVAEVAYFIRPSGSTTPNGTALFSLFRRQAVILTDADATQMNTVTPQAAGLWATTFDDVSCVPSGGNLRFNNFADVVTPANRSLIYPAGNYGPQYPGGGPITAIPIYSERAGEAATNLGNDLLLTDVLSFCVQVFPSTGTDFTDLNGPFPATYDTSTTPLPFNIKAIQVIIRVWDTKTQQARQVTIMQDM